MSIAIAVVFIVAYIGITKKNPDKPPAVMEMPPLIRRYVQLPTPQESDIGEWTDPMDVSGYSSDDETSSTQCVLSPLRL